MANRGATNESNFPPDVRKPLFVFLTVVGGLLVVAVLLVLIDSWPADKAARLEEAPLSEPMTTANTTRVQGGGDPFADAVAISQMIYPATRDQNKPGAVLLVPVDDKATAIAATSVQHFPVNAPILYANRDSLPDVTRDELRRLDPEGVMMDGNTQVYLLGDLSGDVEDAVNGLGLETRRLRGGDGTDPVANAESFDKWKSTLENDHADVMVIADVSRPEFAMSGAAWNAHNGDGLLYVDGDQIPGPTRDALSDRDGGAFIFVFGDETSVSAAAAAKLTEYGIVERIPGATPQEVAVNFAGFRDAGTNFPLWVNNIKRDFGWGIAESGHGFTLVNPANWQPMVTATAFSHMGKHTPMLLLEDDGTVPEAVAEYLELVQPGATVPEASTFNHGWIIGTTDSIPEDSQIALESLLRPTR